MTDLSAAALPVSVLKPLALPGAGASASTLVPMDDATKRARIDAKAKEFEQSFLSIMFGQMFEGTSRGLFGGGEGEEAFTGFLTDAMSKSVEQHGGVGLAKSLSADMLKMQGLSAKPAAGGTGAAGSGAKAPALTPFRTIPSQKTSAQQLDIAA